MAPVPGPSFGNNLAVPEGNLEKAAKLIGLSIENSNAVTDSSANIRYSHEAQQKLYLGSIAHGIQALYYQQQEILKRLSPVDLTRSEGGSHA